MFSLFSVLEYKPLNHSEREFISDLYDKYKKLMYATAQKYISDFSATEDIVQDSLVKLMKKSENLQTLDGCILAGYVVSTVRNTAINHLIKQGIIKKHLTEDCCKDNETEKIFEIEELLIVSEQSQALVEIWPMLPENDQLLLEGKYLLGYTDTELASLLKCKVGSIRMKLTRTRRKALKLIVEMKGYEIDND